MRKFIQVPFFQDLVENQFERNLLSDIIEPDNIGVTFDDIGALENVKDTLEELIIVPLKRPELFSKGQLLKVLMYIQLFGLDFFEKGIYCI
jgi:SpoVK/Ycf46/Vps4 family AAA+-type ATPase